MSNYIIRRDIKKLYNDLPDDVTDLPVPLDYKQFEKLLLASLSNLDTLGYRILKPKEAKKLVTRTSVVNNTVSEMLD